MSHAPDKKSFSNGNSNWELSRRNFVKINLIGGLLVQAPFLNSCVNSIEDKLPIITLSNSKVQLSLKLIQDVQNILFPEDELGPGAKQLKSDDYLIWVLNDELLDPNENRFIIDGFVKLDKTCNESQGSDFDKLSEKKQLQVIEKLSITDWGEKWLSRLLTLIFESMFANPNYGSNPDGIGWKWLNHQAGYPQPTAEQVYPSLLEKNKEEYIKSLES